MNTEARSLYMMGTGNLWREYLGLATLAPRSLPPTLGLWPLLA